MSLPKQKPSLPRLRKNAKTLLQLLIQSKRLRSQERGRCPLIVLPYFVKEHACECSLAMAFPELLVLDRELYELD